MGRRKKSAQERHARWFADCVQAAREARPRIQAAKDCDRCGAAAGTCHDELCAETIGGDEPDAPTTKGA